MSAITFTFADISEEIYSEIELDLSEFVKLPDLRSIIHAYNSPFGSHPKSAISITRELTEMRATQIEPVEGSVASKADLFMLALLQGVKTPFIESPFYAEPSPFFQNPSQLGSFVLGNNVIHEVSAVTGNKESIFFGDLNGYVHHFNREKQTLVPFKDRHERDVTWVRIKNDDTLLSGSCKDVIIWDAQKMIPVTELRFGQHELSSTSNGEFVVVFDKGLEKLRAFKVKDDRSFKSLQFPKIFKKDENLEMDIFETTLVVLSTRKGEDAKITFFSLLNGAFITQFRHTLPLGNLALIENSLFMSNPTTIKRFDF